ncbi:Acetyltransferase (GNAT) domain [Rhizoctonia solani]|uniref:Acetyltransferase (GNAT) domain n=2 Tax=Rhizoctonia solani TaxID=456999 RepID=A0A8H7HEV0_9AGAM|nr:Acetyltransferase (GNAT) domain [Rhizoctonia solani]
MMPKPTRSSENYPYNSRYADTVQYNSETDEPFIALLAPYSNIRLTPPRLDDTNEILPLMNIPQVIMNFATPPYPYLREHCDGWLKDRVQDYENAMVHMSNIDGDVGFLDLAPLRHIREVAPDGTETFLGDIGLIRESAFCEIKDQETRAAMVNANMILPPGDPDIVWTFGGRYYLRPTHHGRGIMTAAIKTMIDLWATPHMNAHRFYAATFPENIGSQKVFLKNGFEIVDRVIGAVQFPESKGGHIKDSIILRRDIRAPL